jgi:hypothetical protein
MSYTVEIKEQLSLCLMDQHEMKICNTLREYLQLSFISALDGGEWSASGLGYFTLEESALPYYALNRRLAVFAKEKKSELLGVWTLPIIWNSKKKSRKQRFENWMFPKCCFLHFKIPDDKKVQDPSNSEWYIPSSEPFRF